MPTILQRHPMLAALAVVASLLAAAIGIELALGTPSVQPSPAAKRPAPDSKLLPAVVATSPDAYPETVARPLFIATRRPAPDAPAQQASIPKGQYILQGVTIHGDTRIAFLREKSSGRTYRVERGKDVNGVTLASVEPDRVVLALGGDREELVMTVQKGPPPPAQPPQPAQPVPFVQAPTPASPQVQSPIAAPVGHAVTGAGPFLPPGFNPNPTPAPPARPATAPAPAGTAPGTAPAQAEAPLSAEETLARRRARRVQQPGQ
jgi:hypothetical protein